MPPNLGADKFTPSIPLPVRKLVCPPNTFLPLKLAWSTLSCIDLVSAPTSLFIIFCWSAFRIPPLYLTESSPMRSALCVIFASVESAICRIPIASFAFATPCSSVELWERRESAIARFALSMPLRARCAEMLFRAFALLAWACSR